ncbi:MAG: DMT family transporter [Candidatus Limiplasma sp.]|nr:DMT family transporter [Candidatus Limiplasma sp.]
MRGKPSYHLYAAITILFWSMAFVFTRLALKHFSADALGLLRYLIASAALLVVALFTRMKRPALRDVPWFLLSGAVGFAVYMMVFNRGSQSVSSSTGSVILATTPILTALLARWIYKEKLRGLQYAAIGVSFLGVAVLTVLRGGFTLGGGLVFMFASALLVAIYNLLQRRLTRTYTALQSTTYSIFAGTLMLCVYLPQAIPEVRTAAPEQFLYLAILGIFSSAVAYCAWAKALSLAENASSVSNYMFITPFLTTLLGLWIAGEPLELSTAVGGALIIGGLLLFRFGPRLLRARAR